MHQRVKNQNFHLTNQICISEKESKFSGWDISLNIKYKPMLKNLNLVHVTIEDMTSIMREVVATELQKVKELISLTPKEDDSDKILTRKEVCELFGVTETTLFNWNNDKILVNFKVGRRVYYKKSDVLAILNPLKEAS